MTSQLMRCHSVQLAAKPAMHHACIQPYSLSFFSSSLLLLFSPCNVLYNKSTQRTLAPIVIVTVKPLLHAWAGGLCLPLPQGEQPRNKCPRLVVFFNIQSNLSISIALGPGYTMLLRDLWPMGVRDVQREEYIYLLLDCSMWSVKVYIKASKVYFCQWRLVLSFFFSSPRQFKSKERTQEQEGQQNREREISRSSPCVRGSLCAFVCVFISLFYFVARDAIPYSSVQSSTVEPLYYNSIPYNSILYNSIPPLLAVLWLARVWDDGKDSIPL